MPRVTRPADHLSLAAVQEHRANATRPWHRRAWDVIYTALADPRPAAQIALQLGVSKDFVHQVVSRYKRFGPDALNRPGSGGRHHAYLTAEQEAAFLEPFHERAAQGDIPTVHVIQQALEAHLGQAVDSSTVYRLLERHHWRKVQPRPQHPQSSEEARTTWKKNLLTR